MRGTDLKEEPVKEYPGFTFDRQTRTLRKRDFWAYSAHICTISVNWRSAVAPATIPSTIFYPTNNELAARQPGFFSD
jgi:hypothetical protein